jgi:hypothetical protein
VVIRRRSLERRRDHWRIRHALLNALGAVRNPRGRHSASITSATASWCRFRIKPARFFKLTQDSLGPPAAVDSTTCANPPAA